MFYFVPIFISNLYESNINIPQLREYILFLPIFILISLIFHYIIGWKNLNLAFQMLLTYTILDTLQKNNSNQTQTTILFFILLLVLTIFLINITTISFKSLTMHYKPKIGLIISTVAILSFISILTLSLILPLNNINISPLALIILILSFEKYIKLIIRYGAKKTISLLLSTFTSLAINLIIATNTSFKILLIKYPISIAAVLIIFIIGFWKTFRLSEYYRFWELLNKETSDDQEIN